MKKIVYIQPQETIGEQICVIPASLNTENVLDAVFDEKHEHYGIRKTDNFMILEVMGFDEHSPFQSLNGIQFEIPLDATKDRYWEIPHELMVIMGKDDKPEQFFTHVPNTLNEALKTLKNI